MTRNEKSKRQPWNENAASFERLSRPRSGTRLPVLKSSTFASAASIHGVRHLDLSACFIKTSDHCQQEKRKGYMELKPHLLEYLVQRSLCMLEPPCNIFPCFCPWVICRTEADRPGAHCCARVACLSGGVGASCRACLQIGQCVCISCFLCHASGLEVASSQKFSSSWNKLLIVTCYRSLGRNKKGTRSIALSI